MDYATVETVGRGIAVLLGVFSLSLVVAIAGFRFYFQSLRKIQQKAGSRSTSTSSKKKIAFFHPYCSSGGGGERVLWKAIQALDELHAEGLSFEIVIYTVDESSENYRKALFEHVQSRFSIKPTTSVDVSFAHLDKYSRCFGTSIVSTS